MTKARPLCLAILLCVPCLGTPQQGQQTLSNPNASAPAGETLEGCVQRSRGEYTLTDANGVLHHLSGGSKMQQHIGHEVQMFGTSSVRTIDTTPPGGASSAIEQRVFRIKSVKDLGLPCR